MRRKRSDPGSPLKGAISIPGDKSVSHRALILSALASGESRIVRSNLGADVGWTAAAVRLLGARVEIDEANATADVESTGLRGLREPPDIVYCGNSGTSLRLLAGVCAGIEGLTVLSGDASLLDRPMLRVVAPLRQMGASVDGRRHGDRPPLTVRGRRLHGIDLELPVSSAQVKSAVLLAGLGAEGDTSVVEPQPSRDHTERMLSAAGVGITGGAGKVSLSGGQEPNPMRWEVPGDPSSAAFLVVAALLLEGSDLTISHVSLNPTRIAYLDVLARMGGNIELEETGEAAGEPIGDFKVKASRLNATQVSGDEIARVIDEIPVLAVAAARAEGETVFRDAAELRVKESDRIESMTEGLRALGVTVEPTHDGMAVSGPAELTGAVVESHGDHRVALALAVAGLVAEGRVRVEGWSCVNTSFPEFLDVLAEARGS